jgi:alpha-tubulin suppressor-like RCC1 family protein
LASNGHVLCWGYNDYGQLGRDGTASFGAAGELASAQPIVFSDTVPAIHIATQAGHVCAAFANGRTRCWGMNSSQELGDGTAIDRGSASGFYSVSLVPYISFGPAMTHQVVQVATGM